MSLNWYWSQKVGEVIETKEDGNTYKCNLYSGNALLICIYEYKENENEMYTLKWFFGNEEHAKNCLGITKEHENMFEDKYIFTLYKSYNKTQKIVQMLAKAKFKYDISIILKEDE